VVHSSERGRLRPSGIAHQLASARLLNFGQAGTDDIFILGRTVAAEQEFDDIGGYVILIPQRGNRPSETCRGCPQRVLKSPITIVPDDQALLVEQGLEEVDQVFHEIV
jgi:hypothetical protein